MQNRLIILSDLWGFPKSDWMHLYIQNLAPHFDIKIYDSCQLANIDRSDYTQENLHQQFVKGGINHAVDQLLSLETDKVTVLAFSIGGTIAWKTGLLGLSMDNFYAISATRLRYEKEIPSTNIHLYYGKKDLYQPKQDWLASHHLNKITFENEDHDCYQKPECIEAICKKIIDKTFS
jgi:hypothetical protein